ncbi:hypothetical protein [Rufibacter hautae]|uniref:Uncharacterized protein n=1 Tax=Rufibacter hautae TaxID=2595005 RepID=A0A5B6TIK0_9BACT|nr:hypothetical protein [Rufibacter hautae]KAA3439320.1 hypothetical protein FOA19_01145 [Rufibacter hautae]
MDYKHILKNSFLALAVIMMIVPSACKTENSQKIREGKESGLFINARDSRDSSDIVSLSSVTLFKNGDTLKTDAPKYPSYYLWLGKFEKGTYKISYRNIFDQTVSQIVKATGASIDTVLLYVDKADYTDVVCRAKIDRLKEGEYFTIRYASMGCSHFYRDSLTITNRNGEFIARNKSNLVYLSDKQVEAVRQFEYQTTLIGGGGCTTMDTYQILYKNEISKATDRSCDWRGFVNLKRQLFRDGV